MTEPSTHKPLTIVGGLQLDDTSDDVVGQLRQLVRGSKTAEVHLCHVCPGDTDNPERAMEQLAQCERRVLDWAQSALAGEPLMHQTQLHVALGDPAEVLGSFAIQVKADLIVVGTHRKNRWQRLVEGSVVRQLVDDAPVSVCVAATRTQLPTGDTVGRTAATAPSIHAAGSGAHRYQRSIPLSVPQSTVGPTAPPVG